MKHCRRKGQRQTSGNFFFGQLFFIQEKFLSKCVSHFSTKRKIKFRGQEKNKIYSKALLTLRKRKAHRVKVANLQSHRDQELISFFSSNLDIFLSNMILLFILFFLKLD